MHDNTVEPGAELYWVTIKNSVGYLRVVDFFPWAFPFYKNASTRGQKHVRQKEGKTSSRIAGVGTKLSMGELGGSQWPTFLNLDSLTLT